MNHLQLIDSEILSPALWKLSKKTKQRDSTIFYLTICAAILSILTCMVPPVQASGTTALSGIQIFPSDYVWNVPIDTLPVHANSSEYIAVNYGSAGKLIPSFGYGATGNGAVGGGFAFNSVNFSVVKSDIIFEHPESSVKTRYPIPLPYPDIEGPGINGTCNTDAGDCHTIIFDTDSKIAYELYGFSGNRNQNGAWQAGSGAVWNLSDYSLVERGRADAAGLPMIVGMVRYDEVASGSINHALRMAIPYTRYGYLNYAWPARQGNSIYVNNWTSDYPRMGERFRLKASFDISKFSPTNQVILTAMKKYGVFVADNGGTNPAQAWQISGIRDSRWNWADLKALTVITGNDLEAVDESLLMINKDSGQVRLEKVPASTTPISEFTGTPVSGIAPLNVQFTNTPANTTTSWIWTFGDGSGINATVQNPVHTYTAAGTYTVTLKVTNAAGINTTTRTNYIRVVAAPEAPDANFSATPISGSTPLKVQFIDSSTNGPTSWIWTFGDGSVVNATVQNPVHTYTAAGTYTVTLKVTNAVGSTTKMQVGYITVLPLHSETSTSSITVTSPNGGESLIEGSNQTISWTSSGNVGSYVKIEVLKADKVVRVLWSGALNSGTASPWIVSCGGVSGSDYRIRITSATYPEITDTSNNFTIISNITSSTSTKLTKVRRYYIKLS
jgi:PKD repeat protein